MLPDSSKPVSDKTRAVHFVKRYFAHLLTSYTINFKIKTKI
ncbi:hypothetical protein ENHY17A_140029 [Moraxellaceae bacterium 17A]|nr:hypothetical protein ENHY17A_140029 [Moraxellaceae bacterium 17A]